MDGQLIFCNDGVLRLSINDNEPAIPLISLQKIRNEDKYYILRYLTNTAAIESKTTLKKFMIALEPWAEVFTKITDRNVSAWIEESKKFTPNSSTEIEWVGIYKCSSFNREYDYEYSGGSIDEFLNSKREVLDHFSEESYFTASGFITGGKDRWSISGDISDIKNLPLIVHKYALHSLTLDKSEVPTTFSNIKGVKQTNIFTYFKTVAFEPTLLDLVKAVFVEGLFYDTPKSSKNSLEQIMAIKESVDLSLNNDKKTQPHLVTENSEENDATPKIHFADGCFDSLIESHNREQAEWDALKSICFREYNEPLIRVGAIQIGQAPEENTAGWVFDD